MIFYFILKFSFYVFFGQIVLPTFQGAQKVLSSSSYPILSQCSGDNMPTNIPFNNCSSSNCDGASLCSEPSCESTNISMRWSTTNQVTPDNLVLTMQGGNTVTLSALTTGDRGWYRTTNFTTATHGSTNTNTYTGNSGGTSYYRSWFSWRLCSIAGQTVTAAKIELDIDQWYNFGGGQDSYSKIWEVSNTTHAEIKTTKNNAAGKEIWNDLGNGLLYSCQVIERNNLGLYTFQLSSAAVSKINGLNGAHFIVGNSISCE